MALTFLGKPSSYFRHLTLLKKLFWLYFFLLIFEGALRKWVTPQLSAPLLIIRDPISLLIIWEAYRTHKWPDRWTPFLAGLTVVFVGLFVLQITTGDNPLIVGLFGLRSYLLPFPVIFIMGENFDEEDLRKLGACTLWLMMPMAAIEVAQYLSPATSFLNNGAYEGGSQIDYVAGHARASGTFSFVVGAENFDSLAAVFILFGMTRAGLVKHWLLRASAFAVMLSIPMLGSRSVVFELAAIAGMMGVGALMGVSQFGKVLKVVLPICILAFIVSFVPVFSQAMQSMIARFTGATALEGGGVEASMYERALQPAVNAVEEAASDNDWMGIGIGRDAVAMQAFLNGKIEAGIIGEDEFSHELEEMGPIGAGFFELFKVFLAVGLFGAALMRAREDEPLSLLIFPVAATAIILSTLEQPTIQGFTVIDVAICIAASKRTAETGRLWVASGERGQLTSRRVDAWRDAHNATPCGVVGTEAPPEAAIYPGSVTRRPRGDNPTPNLDPEIHD